MRRGSSGASFIFGADAVVKYGNRRVGAQGAWLLEHSTSGVPRVINVEPEFYEMERLVSAPTWALDHWRILDRMLTTLNTQVWVCPAEVKLDRYALEVKVSGLLRDHNLGDIYERLFGISNRVNWDTLTACLTHGDPTFENVMFREDTGDLVLIDPLPATPAVPDLRCVDIGKIIQSTLGWEFIRYGDVTAQFAVTPTQLHTRVPDDNEWTASVFWAAVHLLRLLPYVDSHVASLVIGRIYDALLLL